MPRPSLEQAIADPGFTPSVRDASAIVDLLGNDDLVKHAERALARVGSPALDTLARRFAESGPPLRARILRTIGRFPEDPRAVALLLAALGDTDPKTRRNATIALGHTRAEGVEQALLDAWDTDPRPEMRRSLAASLGKVGTARSLTRLREASASDDTELARIAARGAMMVARTASRVDRGRLDGRCKPAQPTKVHALSRGGVEDLLAEELARIDGIEDVRVLDRGLVQGSLRTGMEALFGARTMLSFRFPLTPGAVMSGEDPSEAIARAATSDEARAVFATWTEGAVRYRIAWSHGGHQRAATWQTAQAIARLAPEFVNDPTASLWELVVDVSGQPRMIAEAGELGLDVDVALAPRALFDPRFTWRRGDVPAASHPTLAAALARVAGVRADDVVWDPFVGSGAELVERALLGPYRALLGSDLDPRALTVCRDNLAAAGREAQLEQADATVHAPHDVTLILTNPPMGRRAVRTAGLNEVLDRFVTHAASVLRPGGRLVWLAPWPGRTRAAATKAGLSLDWARAVDMGGFEAELQRWLKP